jgi:hypothetical protein
MYKWQMGYVLWELTLPQALAMWRRGIEILTGDDPMPPETPDLERFYELYGDSIKRE